MARTATEKVTREYGDNELLKKLYRPIRGIPKSRRSRTRIGRTKRYR